MESFGFGEFTPPPAALLGRWRLLRADAALDFAPGVRMEFCEGGRLHYTIGSELSDQVVELIYRVEGDLLETDNPRAPHRASTHFHFGAGGVLVFDFSGARALFVREEPRR